MNIQLLTNLPSTKKGALELGKSIRDMILEGEESPINFMVKIKIIEEALEVAKKDPLVQDYVLEEAEKNGKTFEVMGASVTVGENGTRYDYTACNDSVWSDLNNQIQALTDQRKEREVLLKAIKYGDVANTDTGETLVPPVKTSTRGIKITLK